MSIVGSILGIANGGIHLSSQILARTSPKELKELEALGKRKIDLLSKIKAYRKNRRPSQRVQTVLENYLTDLTKVCDEIELMQKVSDTKLQLIFAQLDKSLVPK